MRRLRDLEDSGDPAVATLARLFRSVGDLDPPPGADQRVCDALVQNARLREAEPRPMAIDELGRAGMGTVYALEPERLDRPVRAARPPRRRRSIAIAATAAGVAVLAVFTVVVVRPPAGDDRTVAPPVELPTAASRESVESVAPAAAAIATTAPHTEVPAAAVDSPRQERTAVPPQLPHPPPAPAPSRTLRLRVPGAPAEPLKPPETAPHAEQPAPDGWTPVDAATASAAGVASGGHLIMSRTGGPCRPGFICIYQRAQLRGVAYGVSLGASISSMAKLRCPGCSNPANGNGETFEAQMSSWDNETDRRYCWYYETDLRGTSNSMPPHTKRRAVPVNNNDRAVSMGPC